MPASLATYQSAANSIYDPQLQSDLATAKNTMNSNVATLESGKGQINTDYTTAVQNLQQAVQDQTGQINQLYSERLGGNFSGLQGNDMGQMFARSNQQQANIESTRANKLAAITTAQTNEANTYNTTVGSLNSKYAGLKSQYAQDAYASAAKDEQDQAYKQAQLNLSYAKLANSSNSGASSAAGKYKVGQYSSGNKYYTGPNGQTNLFQYAMGSNGGDINAAYQEIKSQLKTGSATDKGAYNGILRLEKQGKSVPDILNSLQKSNGYIFD